MMDSGTAGRSRLAIFAGLAVLLGTWFSLQAGSLLVTMNRKDSEALADAKILSLPRAVNALPELYLMEAAANLSSFQNRLASRIFAQYRASTDCEKGCPKRATEPGRNKRFELFAPFVSCPPDTILKRWGNPIEGGKWVCGAEKLEAPCTVFSLGSNAQFDFEEAILRGTPCDLHTYDCTCDGVDLSARHHYHKKCLGSEEKAKEDPKFVSLKGEMDRLGVLEVSLLKMDIEGFEYDILSTWEAKDPLPTQIVFELHYGDCMYQGTQQNPNAPTTMWGGRDVTLGELGVFVAHLAHLGYAIVNKEDNDIGILPHAGPAGATELTVFRVKT